MKLYKQKKFTSYKIPIEGLTRSFTSTPKCFTIKGKKFKAANDSNNDSNHTSHNTNNIINNIKIPTEFDIIKQAYRGLTCANLNPIFYTSVPPFETITIGNKEVVEWTMNDNTRKIVHYAGIPTIQKLMPWTIGSYTLCCIVKGVTIKSLVVGASMAFLTHQPFFWPFIVPGMLCMI